MDGTGVAASVDSMAATVAHGAVYVMNIKSVKEKNISDFTRVKKYVMNNLNSIDIDNALDWEFAEYIMRKKEKDD